MKNEIRLLNENTINKIAAGEVVERPLSVVKELVENSIDSGADEIIVEIKNGGKTYIRVSDNGSGIYNSEIEKTVIKHATSKITSIEDLQRLDTLGFRGEALSSISSVSSFEILSRNRDEDAGKVVRFNNGKIIESSYTGCTPGTTVIVKDLFKNVPARLSFLNSDSSEANYITDFLSKLALVNNDISFKYIRDNKVIFSVSSGSSLKNRIALIFGNDFSESLIKINAAEKDKTVVTGYMTDLNYLRSNRKNQIIFVNKRMISDSKISEAVESGYGTRLPIHRFPSFILFVEMPASNVDVNIHPRKTNVKFKNLKILQSLIYKAVFSTLESYFLSRKIQQEKPVRQVMKNIPVINTEKPGSNNTNKNEPEQTVIEIEYAALKNPEDSTAVVREEIMHSVEKNHVKMQLFIEDELQFIGFLFNTYILFQDSTHNKLLILDQHAAHERINFEKYLIDFREGSLLSQELLIPQVIQLSPSDYSAAVSQIEKFEKLGFDVRDGNYNSVIINAVPVIFTDSNIRNIFYSMLDGGKNSAFEDLIRKACRASVKAGDIISVTEAQNLVKSLMKCQNKSTCPHGRPVWLEYSKYEIEKFFNRIQNQRK